jgi:hypothetical protein
MKIGNSASYPTPALVSTGNSQAEGIFELQAVATLATRLPTR